MTDLKIIPRSQWGARVVAKLPNIAMPTPQLYLHHSAGDHQGAAGMRSIQRFHVDNLGWSDIGYSFGVDPDTLEVFEARGAGVQGGHTFGKNKVSHGIVVMGNFETRHPSEALKIRLAQLVHHGHRSGWWGEQFSGGHRDVRATACPGYNLYLQIPYINVLAINMSDENPVGPSPLDLTLRQLMDLHQRENT